MALDVAPLKSTFMIAGIVGFFISAVYLLPRSKSWGFAFTLIFVIMIVASLISMTYAPVGDETTKTTKK